MTHTAECIVANRIQGGLYLCVCHVEETDKRISDFERLDTQLDAAKKECERLGTEATKLQLLLEAAENERDELRDDLKWELERVDQLRAELRRYEPSDAIMYTLADRGGLIDEAAGLLRDGYRVDATADWKAFNARVDAWLERAKLRPALTAPIPEPHKTILGLHTVIDEARRLFDKAWDDDEKNRITSIEPDTWTAIDEWRNRVLVQQAREAVSGELAELRERYRERETLPPEPVLITGPGPHSEKE